MVNYFAAPRWRWRHCWSRPRTVRPSEQRALAVAADADTDLMHDLLAELLNLLTVEAFIWRDAVAEEASRFEANLSTQLASTFAGEIKAVTYHQLTVENAEDGWHARIIFDV